MDNVLMHNVIQLIYDIINCAVSYYFSEIGNLGEFQYVHSEVKMEDLSKENYCECTYQTVFDYKPYPHVR